MRLIGVNSVGTDYSMWELQFVPTDYNLREQNMKTISFWYVEHSGPIRYSEGSLFRKKTRVINPKGHYSEKNMRIIIPKGHYSENTLTAIIPKGHYSENNTRVIIPKIK